MTPTSYLELISTFKTLLGEKRTETATFKNRYLVGLEKLNSSAEQVAGMQVREEVLINSPFTSAGFSILFRRGGAKKPVRSIGRIDS